MPNSLICFSLSALHLEKASINLIHYYFLMYHECFCLEVCLLLLVGNDISGDKLHQGSVLTY